MKKHISNLVTDGSWENAWDHPHYQPQYTFPCSGAIGYTKGACANSNDLQGVQYRWKPKNGKLYNWSKEAMCKLFHGKRLLLIGDSLTEEFYLSLLSSMWSDILIPKNSTKSESEWRKLQMETFQQCYSYCPETAPVCSSPNVVDCGLYPSINIGFFWSIFLEEENEEWKERIRAFQPDLILINTGAHFQETSQFIGNIVKTLRMIREMNPNISIIFRTTSSGHKNCASSFTSPPLLTLPDPSSLLLVEHKSYHWESFQEQIKALNTALSHPEFHSILILDVYPSTMLRSDSHPMRNGDCLHYCMPGPIDHWVSLFFNVLLRLVSHTKHPPVPVPSSLSSTSTSSLTSFLNSSSSDWSLSSSSSSNNDNNTHLSSPHHLIESPVEAFLSSIYRYPLHYSLPVMTLGVGNPSKSEQGYSLLEQLKDGDVIQAQGQRIVYLYRINQPFQLSNLFQIQNRSNDMNSQQEEVDHPKSSLFRVPNHPTRHMIPDVETFMSLRENIDFNQVRQIGEIEWKLIPVGKPLKSVKT